MKCALDFCEREAALTAKYAGIRVCKSHYQMDYLGREMTPIRPYKDLPMDDKGRVCTRCERFKPWDEFYLRTNGNYQAACKRCFSEINRAARERRLAMNLPCKASDECQEPANLKGYCTHHYYLDYRERSLTQ